jgi:hypothetical protein
VLESCWISDGQTTEDVDSALGGSKAVLLLSKAQKAEAKVAETRGEARLESLRIACGEAAADIDRFLGGLDRLLVAAQASKVDTQVAEAAG